MMKERHLLLLCICLMFIGQIIILIIYGNGSKTRFLKKNNEDVNGRYIYFNNEDLKKFKNMLETIKRMNSTDTKFKTSYEQSINMSRGLYTNFHLQTIGPPTTITGK